MSFENVCPLCASGRIKTVLFDEFVQAGKKSVRVSGMRASVCSDCSFRFATEADLSSNVGLTERAILSTPGAMTPGLLRTLREKNDLTQREASKLFGAGESAFGKWESSQSDLSGPAALLAQCALVVPGVVDFLKRIHSEDAAQRDVRLEPALSEDDWTDAVDFDLTLTRSEVAQGTLPELVLDCREYPDEATYAFAGAELFRLAA